MSVTGADASDAIAQVERSLQRLELAAIRQLAQLRARTKLPDEELFALLLVAEQESVTTAALSEALGLSRSGAGALVMRLQQSGLVERQTDPDDRRVRRITLSRAGRERLSAARAHVLDRLVADLGALGPSELRALRNLTERFAAAIAGDGTATQRGTPLATPDPVWRRWA